MENIQNISIDVNDNHLYETIYSKQYDQGRKVYFSVTRDGTPISLDGVTASFEMKKQDGTVIIKSCEIIDDEVIVVLDSNITVFYGARIPFQLKLVNDLIVLTTVTGYLHIEESVVKLDDIESSSDFSTYTDILLQINQKYSETKSYADNAKTSADKSKESELNAKTSETNAKQSETVASVKADAASTSASNASNSEVNAKASETNASTSELNAKVSETNAATSKNAAKTSETNAKTSETNAKSYADNAKTSADKSKEYAVGTNDSSKYYYEQAKTISESFSGALKPMGTITFSELLALSNYTSGDMYNISDEFVTTDSFKEGTGNTIPAGSNVYRTSDSKWDVLAGTPVTGVKGESEKTYQRGNVNITRSSLGITHNIVVSNEEPATLLENDEWLLFYE